jgi:hypothetical protein
MRVVVRLIRINAALDPTLQPRGPALATHLLEAHPYRFFVSGVFHGDPHPGNLFVLTDGRICLNDFGLVGDLDRRTRANLPMQRSLGPRWGETPVLAVVGYVAALWLTWRLVRDFARTRWDG